MDTREAVAAVYDLWVKAWNEDISVIDSVTAPECVVHQARTDGKEASGLRGAEALKGIIADARKFFADIKMEVVVGPIVEAPYVSARWRFTATYKGSMPGAKANAGKSVVFHGMEIFLLEEGKFKEYWVSSDGIHMMQQLEM